MFSATLVLIPLMLLFHAPVCLYSRRQFGRFDAHNTWHSLQSIHYKDITDSEARRQEKPGEAPKEGRRGLTEESRGNRGAKGREVS